MIKFTVVCDHCGNAIDLEEFAENGVLTIHKEAPLSVDFRVHVPADAFGGPKPTGEHRSHFCKPACAGAWIMQKLEGVTHRGAITDDTAISRL